MTRRAAGDDIERSDPLWFKDAVIYQLHVKAFFDGDNDGIGDFSGLAQKLDYLKDLGVTALWLLPFYPSPLRDDGYDIADYRGINPCYGTLPQFRALVRECHRRNLRVVTELVINHTSDQHPWFQRARRAKPGSRLRDYYVWSDTDQRYLDTRIIFIDTEKSNWTWDVVAQAYYWHRFYSHQPDLNFDNPRTLREITNVLHFWLRMGVDGLRLDAVPYLVEREGTNNENLPETHAILKRIRAEIDAHYPDRMLLAEANQWPEDVLPYFGDGDECHMAFHFPLMPRMYMAIAQEDRHPITDIMRQTPPVPERSQWAIFLRNHDELTLEMVTDRERDYLWNVYAGDRRMRLNLGIRRRLAPLMDNDRRKIELMKGLVFSMPGTPVVYYGDEIGMGDNVFLGDRDGVRTPMQWSPDRNAGFSRADQARLYLPPIMDPIYGYEAVNVEAQARSPSSLLNWTKRIIAVRQAQKVFGRGSLVFLYPGNRKVLAFLREHEGTTILCVFNLARSAQAVELDLSRLRGRIPVELMGRSAFPPVGELPYLLTLPGYAFHWFVLAEQEALPHWHEPLPEVVPDLVTIVTREGWKDVLAAPARELLERDALPTFVAKQRWFGAKDDTIAGVRIAFAAELPSPKGSFLLAEIDVALGGGGEQRYFLPLAFSSDAAESTSWPLLPFTVARVRRRQMLGSLHDGAAAEALALAIVDAVRAGREIETAQGRVRFLPSARMAEVALAEGIEVRRLGVEQSNSSLLVGDQVIVKLFRRLIAGPHPEVEMGAFLTGVGFANTPSLLGSVERVDGAGSTAALAVVQAFVRNQGDGWNHALDHLQRGLEELEIKANGKGGNGGERRWPPGHYLELVATLGVRTGELHRALAERTGDPAFDPRPIGERDLRAWRQGARRQAEAAFAALRHALRRLPAAARDGAADLLGRADACRALIDRMTGDPVTAVKSRIHGDYHLGQVLVAQNDWYIIDFEGEPRKSLNERRALHSPLRDVAGMMRSFDYAARAAMDRRTAALGQPGKRVLGFAIAWRDAACRTFLDAYRRTVVGLASHPAGEEEARRLLDLFLLERACYEVTYELANRPHWIDIPVKGVLGILDAHATD